MNQEIVFVVDAEGNVSYEMAGFQGEACFSAAEALLKELGKLGLSLEVTNVQRKEGDERVEVSTSRPLSA